MFLFLQFLFPLISSISIIYYNQTVDHFHPVIYDEEHNSTNDFYFNQTVIIDETYKSLNDSSSIVCYIHGTKPLPHENTFPYSAISVAKQTNSTLIAIEHRSFGDSKLLTNNLFLTNVNQAIVDFATILQTYKKINNKRILVIGSDYGGSIAAWLRIQYPSIVDISWSSSSPIKALADFNDSDIELANYIEKYYSKDCLDTIEDMMHTLDLYVKDNKEFVMNIFDFPKNINFSESAVLYILSEGLDLVRKHKHFDQLCNSNKGDIVQQFADILNQSLYEEHSTIEDIDIESLTNSSTRMRYFLQCNELGLFPTNNSQYSLTSELLSLNYYSENCKNNFGIGSQDETLFNNQFDPLNTYLYSMIFTFQEFDKYSTVGYHQDNEDVYIRTAPNAYEQWDLLEENKEKDSQDIINLRNEIIQKAVDLVNDKCYSSCQNGYCIGNQCVCNKNYYGEYCEQFTISNTSFTNFQTIITLVPTVVIIVLGIISWVLFASERSRIKNYIARFV